MIVQVFCIICLIVLLEHLWRTRKYPPGPLGVPFFGYLPFLDPQKPHITLEKLAKRYGPLYSMRLGSVLAVVLSDAKTVREVLKREEFMARAPLYVTHGIMGGNGLICAEGDLWKDQRRHVIDWLKCLGMTKKEGISRSKLESRILTGAIDCVQLLRQDADAAKTGQIDPSQILHHTLGNVINELVFGLKYERDDVNWQYLQTLQEEGIKLIGVSGVVNFLPFLRFWPANKRSIKFLLDGKQRTHHIYDVIISQCQNRLQKELENNPNFDIKQFAISILEHFLYERLKRQQSTDQRLLATAHTFYNDNQLRHLLADMYGAGVDTTLTTLRWLLLFMALNSRCQKKLQSYLSQLPSIEQLTFKHFEGIPYLRACVAEVQRIRSVVPLGFPHGSTRQTNVLGYDIPKNALIIPALWAISMDEKNWYNPKYFQPERFLNEGGDFQVPRDFIPFQTGKRMCVGEEMAHMLLLSFTALIFRQYTLKLGNGMENLDISGESGITLAPPHYEVFIENNTQE